MDNTNLNTLADELLAARSEYRRLRAAYDRLLVQAHRKGYDSKEFSSCMQAADSMVPAFFVALAKYREVAFKVFDLHAQGNRNYHARNASA
jgi:hypothetical protein